MATRPGRVDERWLAEYAQRGIRLLEAYVARYAEFADYLDGVASAAARSDDRPATGSRGSETGGQ